MRVLILPTLLASTALSALSFPALAQTSGQFPCSTATIESRVDCTDENETRAIDVRRPQSGIEQEVISNDTEVSGVGQSDRPLPSQAAPQAAEAQARIDAKTDAKAATPDQEGKPGQGGGATKVEVGAEGSAKQNTEDKGDQAGKKDDSGSGQPGEMPKKADDDSAGADTRGNGNAAVEVTVEEDTKKPKNSDEASSPTPSENASEQAGGPKIEASADAEADTGQGNSKPKDSDQANGPMIPEPASDKPVDAQTGAQAGAEAKAEEPPIIPPAQTPPAQPGNGNGNGKNTNPSPNTGGSAGGGGGTSGGLTGTVEASTGSKAGNKK